MIGQDRIRELLQMALEHSRADQTEARISAGRWALTRFAKSSIHQNMAADNAVIQVRAVFGKKVASASSNRIDEQGIRSGVHVLAGKVPLSEMFGYATSLRSLSQGRATFTMEPLEYLPAPDHVAKNLIL